MTEQPADFFWEASAAALAHSDVATGTMMGFPCLRASGAPTSFPGKEHAESAGITRRGVVRSTCTQIVRSGAVSLGPSSLVGCCAALAS
jgi:hypothetical protein